MPERQEQPIVDTATIASHIETILRVGSDRSGMIVDEFQRVFVDSVTSKLDKLTMKELARRKNPYLYRATGVSTCKEYVDRAFQEYTATMRGNYFGNFFESVARILSGGTKPVGTGEIDLEVQREGELFLYAIKSGASGHNASSGTSARNDLDAVGNQRTIAGFIVHKRIAYAYGRRRTHEKDGIEKMTSKAFWAEMSGDDDFYVKFLEVAALLSPLFQADMDAPYERLLAEAHELFCEDEVIQWDKVIRLVSG